MRTTVFERKARHKLLNGVQLAGDCGACGDSDQSRSEEHKEEMMTKDEAESPYREMAEEIKASIDADCKVTLELTTFEAWSVLAQMQLAVQQPDNRGMTCRAALGVAERIQALVAAEGSPLWAIAQGGWRAPIDGKQETRQ